MHRSGDSYVYKMGSIPSFQYRAKIMFCNQKPGKKYEQDTVSLTLVKCHWNKLHSVYLIHALNQERQVLGRLNFYKCNVFLPDGKHNTGEIPQIPPTKCNSAIHIVAKVAIKLSLNIKHLAMSKTHLQSTGDADRSFCWHILKIIHDCLQIAVFSWIARSMNNEILR